MGEAYIRRFGEPRRGDWVLTWGKQGGEGPGRLGRGEGPQDSWRQAFWRRQRTWGGVSEAIREGTVRPAAVPGVKGGWA